MSFLSSIIDTFTNVRQKDYNEAKHMHAQLVGAHARAGGPAVNIPDLGREVLGERDELPAPLVGHFTVIIEDILASSGLYSILPLPAFDDTEALYKHRAYLRAMATVVDDFDRYHDQVQSIAYAIVNHLIKNLPAPASPDDPPCLNFDIPATHFFHQDIPSILDYAVSALAYSEVIDTPLFSAVRGILEQNFERLSERHRLRSPEYSAEAFKGKATPEELVAGIFAQLPFARLFDFFVPFRLATLDRFKHQYILGKTGSGKSVLLRHQIAHDLHAGYGVVVMTPERDLINDVLSYVPESRLADVVHFDAFDDEPPLVGFNPFTLSDRTALAQRAGELESILVRTLGDMGVKMKPVLSNSIYALLATQGSFHDIPKLLDPQDASYRRQIAGRLDERTREFFEKYDASTYYKDVYEPIINRLDPLLRPPLSTTLTTPTLDFDHILNRSSSIVLCNLSRLRGFQAEIVGQLLLATFQQTFFARDALPERERLPCFFYMDEFQAYATASEQSLKDFLTRARKYKVGIVMAHQNTDDIPGNLLSSIFGNCGTLVGMLMSSKDASGFTREAQLANFRGFDRAETQLQNFIPGEIAIATPDMKQARICRVPERPPFDYSMGQVEALKVFSKKSLRIQRRRPNTDPPSPPGAEPSTTRNPKPNDWEDLGYRLS